MKHIPVRHMTANHEPPMIGNMSIREIGPLVSKQNLKQDLHRHDFYLLLAIERGTGTHEIDFVSHRIRNYSVFFLHPGQVHQIDLAKGSSGFLMQFTNGLYPDRGNPIQFLQQSCYAHTAKSYAKIHSLLMSVLHEYQQKQNRFEEVIHSYLTILLTELIRAGENTTRTMRSRSVNQDRYYQFVSLLEAGFVTHKNVEYYAEQLHVTAYQLNSMIRQAVGKTCSAMIQERILLESKRLLLATTLQVNEIAYQLGYEDPSYFIRFFKKHTGYTPDALRQLQ